MCEPSDGSHEFLAAVANDNIDAVRAKVAADPSLLQAWDNCGAGALHYAQAPEMVRSLCDLGAAVGAVSVSGSTPLHYAARYGRSPQLAEALVAVGVDVNALDGSGCTVFHDVARSRRTFDKVAFVLPLLAAPGGARLDVLFEAKTPAQLAAALGHADLAAALQ